jgi:N6-adenosine-specific RNA methylase IME4
VSHFPPNSDSAYAAGHHPRDAVGLPPLLPTIVRSLATLVEQRARFSTIYADPPWPYTNTAARGAAENHYRTLSLDAIRNQPVNELAADQAHLHLWTTNAFLQAAFRVIRAWGFHYKSCLVWVKPQIGMGNYWRVSHEYLLLGVRGNLPFRDRTCRSWLLARRTAHSRKPFPFRDLIERVSPGPYLELYGREEQPNTGWTVYGNQVERRLF